MPPPPEAPAEYRPLSGVVFIRWLSRAYQNVDAVAPGWRRYGEGWAIGAWFVPFLNMWRPKQIVNDVWQGSGPPEERNERPPAWLLVWWLAFLVNGFLGNIAGRFALNSERLDELRNAARFYMVSDSVDIVAAMLALLVVARMTARMDGTGVAPARGWNAPERPLGSPAGAVSE